MYFFFVQVLLDDSLSFENEDLEDFKQMKSRRKMKRNKQSQS
jgi:hypothetical protein